MGQPRVRRLGHRSRKPAYEIDPWEQIRDYQHGISYAQNRSEVDPDRIAAWGSSFSAGHAFVVAAIDQRVKVVCGQAPFISGRATYTNIAQEYNQVIDPQRLTADRRARAAGEPPAMIPVIGTDPGQATGIPTPDAHDWLGRRHAQPAHRCHPLTFVSARRSAGDETRTDFTQTVTACANRPYLSPQRT